MSISKTIGMNESLREQFITVAIQFPEFFIHYKSLGYQNYEISL